ncbi:MAG: signal peptide peptidase SppA [Bryobacterales bacterium]|nr:signal peptide peptidase SppA [Bryobacterales bacterium]
MKKFLIGLIAGFLLAGLALIIIGFAMVKIGDRKPEIASGSTLMLKLQGQVLEVAQPEIPLPFFESRSPVTVLEVWDLLRKAAADKRVAAIAFEPAGLDAGWAKLDEIRRALLHFRKSGKPVYCYLRNPGSREYYLATAADKIYMTSEDVLFIRGIRAELMYYKQGLDKIGVQMEVENVGPHKDALDPFLKSAPSPETKATTEAILDQVHTSFLATVAEGRKKTVDDIRRLVDDGPLLGPQAVSSGLIDGLMYDNEYLDELKKRLKQGKLTRLSYRDYMKVPASSVGLGGKSRVAVISGSGAILRGSAPGGFDDSEGIYSTNFTKLLRDASEDARIRAVILRVDSPGGDAIASDEILHEVKRLSAKKPLVVSMSDVAASGGYYIAMSGDPVLAYPNTITGSIGVIFGKVNLEKLYEKLGIHVEILTRGKNAALDTSSRPLNEAGRAKLHEGVQAIYRTFLQRVATGRKKKVEEVEPFAGGRVWMGAAAKTNGLVDEMGGLDRAIALVKQKAKIAESEQVQLIAYPLKKSVFEQFFSTSVETMSEGPDAWLDQYVQAKARRMLGDVAPGLDWRLMRNGAYLRVMPYSITVE